jgi:hypothetical protein
MAGKRNRGNDNEKGGQQVNDFKGSNHRHQIKFADKIPDPFCKISFQ